MTLRDALFEAIQSGLSTNFQTTKSWKKCSASRTCSRPRESPSAATAFRVDSIHLGRFDNYSAASRAVRLTYRTHPGGWKAGATVNHADFRGLHKLKAAAGGRFPCGIVFYDREISAGFGGSMYAVPIRALCETF